MSRFDLKLKSHKKSVSRRELKEEGSRLMVKYGLVKGIRTEKGYLSFNDMVLQKFINDFGSEFISKPPALASYQNESSQFKVRRSERSMKQNDYYEG